MSSINKALDAIYPDVREISQGINPNFDENLVAYPTLYEVTGVPLSTSNFKENKSPWIYIVVAIVILIFIIIIGIGIAYYLNGDTSDTTTTDSSDIESNIGSLLTANEWILFTSIPNQKINFGPQIILPNVDDPLGFLDNSHCSFGYYGQNCEFQAHSPDYYNIGEITGDYKLLPITTTSLSLDYNFEDGTKSKTSATNICTKTKGCTGVVYDHKTNKSSLIIHSVKARGDSKFNFSNDTQVYMKKNLRPHYTDKVFGFSGGKPLRYYFDGACQIPEFSNTGIFGTSQITKIGIVSIPLNQLIELDWIPSKIANYTGAIGHYFTSSDQKTPVYTDNGAGEHTLPLSVRNHQKLWVLYIKIN